MTSTARARAALAALGLSTTSLVARPALAEDSGYLQYGVALAAEGVAGAGAVCADATTPCVLGSGGGLAVRVGLRTRGHLYWGGAYELSRQDSAKIYRLAILQQLRAEGRWYFSPGHEVEPFVHAGVGVMGYGNEWGVDTWGPAGTLGFGAEMQLTRRTALGLALNYRAARLASFVDPTGLLRDAGVVHLLGIDLALENRDPL